MYTIKKQFEFSASHQLFGLPAGHQCGRVHGHNYIVEVELAAKEPDSRGFVVDYGELQKFRRFLDEVVEHRHLNDVIDQPSAENLARMFFFYCNNNWRQTVAVSVSETPKTWATYRPQTIPEDLGDEFDFGDKVKV